MEGESDSVDRMLPQLRIILAALILGLIAFGAVVTFLTFNATGGGQSEIAPLMLAVLAGLAVVEIMAYSVIRNVYLAGLRKQWQDAAGNEDPQTPLVQSFMVLTMIGAAMAESVGLFGIIVVIITHAWVALIAALLAIVAIALLFPSRDRFGRFQSKVTGTHFA